MINILSKSSTQVRARVNWAPRFSERRLLLIAGDVVFLALSGLAAVWAYTVL